MEQVSQSTFVDIWDFTTSVEPPIKVNINHLQLNNHDLGYARRKAFGTRFRWIHIPVNDTTLVTTCVKRLVGEEQANSLRNTWLHKVRPTSSIPRDIVPGHARHMEPSFELHTVEGDDEGTNSMLKSTFTLYLPYLNWEVFQNIKDRNPGTDDGLTTHRHLRRTLDQFFYSGLRDTKCRDAGQTVSKWTGESPGKDGRKQAATDSYVVMVDQIWIWVLNDATLVSCFPSDPFQFNGDPNGTQFIDVLALVVADACKCNDLYDLAALLVMHSVTSVFAEENANFADIVAIYRWAISIKAARHTERLEAFGRRQSSHAVEAIAVEGTNELNLALQVVDILDELNMLLLVLEKQAYVLASFQEKLLSLKPTKSRKVSDEKFAITILDSRVQKAHISNSGTSRGEITFSGSRVEDLFISNDEGTGLGASTIDGYAGALVMRAKQKLKTEKVNFERLRADAAQTRGMLIELLDLEQKAASLEEARSTTKQGQAVMLFTIVTIIFLPLSFFTSYFGQNVSEITGDDKNPKSSELWRVAGPISVVIILFALLVAYFIMYPPLGRSVEPQEDEV